MNNEIALSNLVASGGASGSPIFRFDNHCVAAICNCGPPCQDGLGVPMSNIIPNATPILQAAGFLFSLCTTFPQCPGTGNCFDPAGNGTPGCNDLDCCNVVCAIDPFCCNNTWDALCASEAQTLCGNAACGPGAGNCYNPGGNGTPGCDDPVCCKKICLIDPFCCNNNWDALCASQAAQFCTPPPTGACCLKDGTCVDVAGPAACTDPPPLGLGGTFQGGGTTCLGIICPPALNNCANRIPISNGATPFDNTGATTDGPSACGSIGSDIWYNYNAAFTGDLTVSLCGSTFDTVVAVYNGCACPADLANLLACNDQSIACPNVNHSEVIVPVVNGQCYKIQVGGFIAAQGSGTINITKAPVGANFFTTPAAFNAALLATDKRAKASWDFKPNKLLPGTLVTLDDPLNINTHALNPDDPWSNPVPPPVNNPLCGGAIGDCCIANGSIGCNDKVCCSAICNIDPFCCNIEWDGLCADEAAADGDNCPQCGGAPTPSLWPPSVDNVTFQANNGPNPQPPLPNPHGINGLVFANTAFNFDNNILIANIFVDSFDILSGPPAGDNHTAMSIEIVTALSGPPPGPVLVTVYGKPDPLGNEPILGKLTVDIFQNPPPPPVCPGDDCVDGIIEACPGGDPACLCFTGFAGGGQCGGDIGCAGITLCPAGTCPPGFVCVTDTCCGVGLAVCVPVRCGVPLAPLPPGTLTAGGIVGEPVASRKGKAKAQRALTDSVALSKGRDTGGVAGGPIKKTFLGIVMKGNLTIGRVNLFDLNNGGEGISKITVYTDSPGIINTDISGPLGAGFPDGCVNAFDLGTLLGAWCSAALDPDPPGDADPPCEGCISPNLLLADLSGPDGAPDGCVDAFDLSKLLANWCSVAGGNPCGTCF